MNTRTKLAFCLIAGWLLVASATGATPQTPAEKPSQEDFSKLEAVLRTDWGEIVVRFFPADAPKHVAYFIKNVRDGGLADTTFFRVVKYGIIQGGDPFTKDPKAREKYGQGGLDKLKAELNQRPCKRGAVVAALRPDKPDSAGSQFFICVNDQPQLTGKYTVFGEVVSGMKAVELISTSPADDKQLALQRVVVRGAEIRPIPTPPFEKTTAKELAGYRAVILTDEGEIEMEFFPDKAPEHVRQFLTLSRSGLYSGTEFHRIIPGFVVQGGMLAFRQPPADEATAAWAKPLKAEFNDIPHEKGILSMARTDDPDSGVDSFFICLRRLTNLDGKYTVFGKVVRGIDVVDRLAAIPASPDGKPDKRVEIKEIRVIPAPAQALSPTGADAPSPTAPTSSAPYKK